jgi:hypothetical protein
VCIHIIDMHSHSQAYGMVAYLPGHFKTSIWSCMMIKVNYTEVMEEVSQSDPLHSSLQLSSHSVYRSNSGGDNGTNFVGNKHCGQADTGKMGMERSTSEER